MDRRDLLRSFGAAILSGSSRRAQPPRDWDYIIVGAGSSGCVLANRLSADPKTRVLVIEAGGSGDGDAALVTPGRWVSLLGSRWDWGYATEPDEGLAGRSINWPRGKVYGGSSAINAMAYVRGHRRCFDRWAEAAGPSWSFTAVEPLFRRIERELPIAPTSDPHAGHLAFLDAAREIGLSGGADWEFDGRQQEDGAGFYKKNIRNGRRHSAAAAFLAPALERPNLSIAGNTTVQRVVFEKNRAIAVRVMQDGKPEDLRARREIILSAGVIGSPKLLMLSGIGPADALKAHGIRSIVDRPSVGCNLHDHPRVSVRWRSLRPLPPSTTSAGLFVRTGTEPIPNIQFYVGRGVDTADDSITLTVALSQPRSRGSLALRSADPSAAPVIKANYFAEPADLDALVEAVGLARELGATRAYGGLRGEPVDPPVDADTPEALREFIRRTADTIFHPVGTCRMGADAGAVVDADLRVRGVDRLRVADASVMPAVVNSQTNAACLMIAESAAARILGARPAG